MTALFGRGVVKVAQFFTFLILARLLSPTDFGWYGILTTAVSVAALVGSLGLRASFGYEIGQNRRTPAEAAGTALVLWLPLTAVSATCVWIFYGRGIPTLAAQQAGGVIFAAVAGSLLIVLMQGIFLGRGEIRIFALSETTPGVVLSAFTIALALVSSVTLSTALWAYSASFLVAAPIMVRLAVKGVGRLRINFRKLGRSVAFGIVYAVNLVLTTISARLSMFVIEHYIGPAPAGQFFAAIRLNEMILEAATVAGVVLFSNAARQDKGASI
ncbi:oligosaccharide flippase family protein, partial [Mycobacterium sp. ZZG]